MTTTDLFPINRHDKIGELKREIAIRRRVYRDQVFTNRMTREMADRRIAVMEAILDDYEGGLKIEPAAPVKWEP